MSNNVVPFQPVGYALRPLPQHASAERALLGAILLDNRAYDSVASFLEAKHFADPLHEIIWTVAVQLIEGGQTASPVSLPPYLAAYESFEPAGGIKYLIGLMDSVVTVKGAPEYGRLIYDLYLRREVLAICTDAVEAVYDMDVDRPAESEIDRLEQRLFELSALGGRTESLVSLQDAIEKAITMAEVAHRRGGGVIGTPTGLLDLDGKLSGLHRSDLVILAGRPSMGKTALATTIALNAARYFRDTDRAEDKGKLVVFFSLEMSAEQLSMRLLSAMTGLDHHRIRTGALNQQEFARLVEARAEFEGLPLHIDEQPAASVSAIRVRCRRLARKYKREVGLCVVDYLQLIAPPAKTGRDENRTQEVSAITRGLKAVAKSLSIPVLALSQLSRAVEQREDKRPQLSDLRESGSIEQDADAVLFVYREQYYLERTEPQQKPEEGAEKYSERKGRWYVALEKAQNVAEVIIGKQRHGPVGSVLLRFDPERVWFEDLERRHAQAADGPLGPTAPPAAEQQKFDL